MSEYQYYEFVAIDRPLTPEEQATLRRYSSRARITADSFSNEYHWGEFKGDADAWMERYFDAHLYVASWDQRQLQLRLPASSLPPERLFAYADQEDNSSPFFARQVGSHCIFSWNFAATSWDDCDAEEMEFEHHLSTLLALRDELLGGDDRALYLGWLARAYHEELPETALEPSLPSGLEKLSPAQQLLVDFLGLSPDWLQAATNHHSSAPNSDGSNGSNCPIAPSPPRSIEQLEALAAIHSEIRQSEERRQAAARATRLVAEQQALRRRLAENPEAGWQEVESILQIRSGRSYDLAAQKIHELATALQQAGKAAEQAQGLDQFLARHGHRRALIQRLHARNLIKG